MIKISFVVAMNADDLIGINNKLPWDIPDELAHFKRITMGKPVIMGRKTFETIGHPLPGRDNIVITRDQDWQYEGVTVFHTIEDAVMPNNLYCIVWNQKYALLVEKKYFWYQVQ